MAPPDPLLSSVVCTVLHAVERGARPDGEAARRAAHYTLLFCRTGSVQVTVGGATYPLNPSTILVVAPAVPFALGQPSGRGVRVVEILFDARVHGILDLPALYRFPTLHRPTRASMEKIAQAVRRIVYDIGRARPGFEMAVNSHCLFIMSFLRRDLVEQSELRAVDAAARAADLARLAPVLGLVEARYEEPLTLRELADAVHLHPAYFATWFRRITGLPPRHYLARYRLQRAAARLLATDEPLDQVAAATGHADRSHLTRAFQRFAGVTPGQYRRSYRPHALATNAGSESAVAPISSAP
jgi:AraC-like DNA-binding protein